MPDAFELTNPPTESIYLLDSPPSYFSWSTSDGAISYDVLGLKQGQAEIVTWAEGLTETEWEVNREFGFGRWYWFVRANHESGSIKSATQNFEILQSLESPGPLEGIFPGDDEVIVNQDASTTFQWTTSSNATRYEIILAKDGESKVRSKSSNLAINKWTFHEPLESGKWHWQVKAFNWLGQSETAVMTFEVLDVLEAPGTFHGVYPEADDIILVGGSPEALEWTPSSHTNRYEVYLAKDDPALLSKISSNLGDNRWEFSQPLELGTWYWKVVAVNWLGQTETEVMTFEIVEEGVGVDVPDSDIVTHRQVIPSGWSAININLFTEDNRLSGLIPAPPEGTLFFKGLISWDVMQFQFGRWDHDDVLEPGESGLILNPGEPFEIIWHGQEETGVPFTGFFSGATAIAEDALVGVPNGSSVYVYQPTENPADISFDAQWPEVVKHSYAGSSWIPGAVDIQVGDPSQIFCIDNRDKFMNYQFFGRRSGQDVYINNYIPAFGVNAPMGGAGCEFLGGTFDTLVDHSEVPGVIALHIELTVGRDTYSVPLIGNGVYAGYLDVSQGSTYSFIGDHSVELSGFSSTSGGVSVQGPLSGQGPRPPVVFTGLEPELLHASDIGNDCGIPLSFLIPEFLTFVDGESVVLQSGICGVQHPAGMFYLKDQQHHLQMFLERQDADGVWRRVTESEDLLHVVLGKISMEHAGRYRFSVEDRSPLERCGDSGKMITRVSSEFQIQVEPFAFNQLPQADAGEDIHVVDIDGDGLANIKLDGIASFDSDGEITLWRWRWRNREWTGSSVQAEFPVGIHQIELTVQDSTGREDTDEVLVKVYDFEPVFIEYSSMIQFRNRVGEVIRLAVTASSNGPVWGTGLYSDLSALETAALHGGWLMNGEAGYVYVLLENGAELYDGSQKNGVISLSRGNWEGSFRILASEVLPSNTAPTADAGEDVMVVDIDEDGWAWVQLNGSGSHDIEGEIRAWRWRWGEQEWNSPFFDVEFPIGEHRVELTVFDEQSEAHQDEILVKVFRATTLDQSLHDLIGFRNQVGQVFRIPVTAFSSGKIWGTRIYADQSALGTAVVHDGWMKEGQRGNAYVLIEEGAEAYDGIQQNGIESFSLEAWGGSYRILEVSIEHPIQITRVLPGRQPVGNELVTIKLEMVPQFDGGPYWIEEDLLTSHYQIQLVSDEGVIADDLRSVRWGPFSSSQSKTVEYSIRSFSEEPAYGVFFTGRGISDIEEWRVGGADLLLISQEPPFKPPQIERHLPDLKWVGEQTSISLSVEHGALQSVSSISELLPKNVTFVSATGDGAYHSDSHSIFWGPSVIGQGDFSYQIQIESLGEKREAQFKAILELIDSSTGTVETLSHLSSMELASKDPQDLVIHQQMVPSGWSAINNRLIMKNDYVSKLIADAPEGFLFFKWIGPDRGGGLWDVNQVQFGSWNYDDQRLAPGESGIVYNPADPFYIEWKGFFKEIEGFSGFGSAHTMVDGEILGLVESNASVYHYLPSDVSSSSQFVDSYPDYIEASYVSIPGVISEWIPSAPMLTDDPNEIFFVQGSAPSSVAELPDRHLGTDVYFNNYVPGFGVNAPIGQPYGCEFRGGNFDALFGFPQPIQVSWESELNIHLEGTLAGYVDAQNGLVFSDFNWNALGEYGFSYDRALLPNRAGYSAPSPPVIPVGLQPTWVLNPTIGYYSGLVPRDFNMAPANVQVAAGDELVLDLELCAFESQAAELAWESLGDRVHYFLEKQAVNNSWETVMSDSLVESFELLDLSPADSGIYRLGSFSIDVDPDCPVCFDAWQYSEPFTIEVIPATSNPPQIHIQRIGMETLQISWKGVGTLQVAEYIIGPFEDSPDQSNPQRIELKVAEKQFFRVVQ